MKAIILSLLLVLTLSLTAQSVETVLLISNTTSTKVLIPDGNSVKAVSFANTYVPNPLGNGAIWIFDSAYDAEEYWPAHHQATFTATFNAICLAPAKLSVKI